MIRRILTTIIFILWWWWWLQKNNDNEKSSFTAFTWPCWRDFPSFHCCGPGHLFAPDHRRHHHCHYRRHHHRHHCHYNVLSHDDDHHNRHYHLHCFSNFLSDQCLIHVRGRKLFSSFQHLFALYHHHCHLYHTCKVFIFPSWRCILSNNWQKEPKEVYLRICISVLVCRSCCGTWVHARLEFWLTHRVFIFLPQRINGICPEWPQEIFPTSEFIFPDSFTSSEFLHCSTSWPRLPRRK